MYPYPLFWGLDLYIIFIFIGIITALTITKFLFSNAKIDITSQRVYFNFIGISIITGFLGAISFQDIYHLLATGEIKIFSGLTFLGGLVSGCLTFLLLYIFNKNPKIKECKNEVLNILPLGIIIAHCFGRIGCFLVGCCYGKPTNNSFGVIFHEASMAYATYGHKRLYPTQLFEAVFLLILFVVLFILYIKKYRYVLETYLISYGIFRFINEFFRGDDREGIKNFISPSQFISILIIITGIILISRKRPNHQIDD